METIELPRTEARPASALALVVICLGYFMVIVDTTVVNVALLGSLVHDRAGSSPDCIPAWSSRPGPFSPARP